MGTSPEEARRVRYTIILMTAHGPFEMNDLLPLMARALAARGR